MKTDKPERACLRRMMAACLAVAVTHGVVRAEPANAPAIESNAAVRRPSPRLTPDRMPPVRARGPAPATVWSHPETTPRGTGPCTFDNVAPLDDFGDPASQLSESEAPEWNFIGAAADDFMLGDPGDMELCRVTMIRAAFTFADDGSGNPTPTTTWKSVFVTVYEGDVMGLPTGEPLPPPGGQDGLYIVTQQVPAASLENETLVGACRPCYLIDIPVNFLLKKGVRYWLSLVPVHDGAINTTQSFWCISDIPVDTDYPAVQFFRSDEVIIDPWGVIDGNAAQCDPLPIPGEGAYRNLAFTISAATSEPDVTGACCDDTVGGPAGDCADNVSIADCQKANDRFSADATCLTLDPPCGPQTPVACCLPTAVCLPDQSPNQCTLQGGQWRPEPCEAFPCPLLNDECEAPMPLSGGSVSIPFDTTGASVGTGGPLTNCGGIFQDIWFSYEVPCNGTVTVSTLGSSFDTVLAVYGPVEACPPECPPDSPDGDYTELACSSETPESLDSYLVIPATAGQCLLIRVGGKDGVMPMGGMGLLNIDCIETGTGACCQAHLGCEILPEAECIAAGDVFTPGQPCSAQMTCPPPCCVGDVDNNCVVDEFDVPPFVDALLNPPAPGTVEFCRADANRDFVVNALDVAPFIARVLALSSCFSMCCPGDTSGDGVLDGLDVQGLVDAILSPPPCSSVAFCRADVNEDLAVDLADADALVEKLLAGDVCP